MILCINACFVILTRVHVQVVPTFAHANAHHAATWLGFVKWIVDRFHYFGHARDDNVCRYETNPLDHLNRGLVRVISRENIAHEGGIHDDDIGLFGKETWIDDPDHDGNGDPARVPARVVIRDMIDGTTCKLVLIDEINTSICESTFANLNVYAPLLRSMSPQRSQFYLREVVASKNAYLTEELHRKELAPRNPTFLDEGRRKVPLRNKMVGIVVV